jgi:hypothetical protein
MNTPVTPMGPSFTHGEPEGAPSVQGSGEDDGPLDSIGKAIAAPIEGAAEAEEPSADPSKPPVPPG